MYRDRMLFEKDGKCADVVGLSDRERADRRQHCAGDLCGGGGWKLVGHLGFSAAQGAKNGIFVPAARVVGAGK